LKKINQLHTGTLAFESISPETFEVLKSNYILFLEEVLGLTMETPEYSDTLINGLLTLYKEFKDQRKYDKVDEIRATFKSMGLIIKDMKNSIDWGFEE
jgi:cysteinyl-tRNA synthetase